MVGHLSAEITQGTRFRSWVVLSFVLVMNCLGPATSLWAQNEVAPVSLSSPYEQKEPMLARIPLLGRIWESEETGLGATAYGLPAPGGAPGIKYHSAQPQSSEKGLWGRLWPFGDDPETQLNPYYSEKINDLEQRYQLETERADSWMLEKEGKAKRFIDRWSWLPFVGSDGRDQGQGGYPANSQLLDPARMSQQSHSYQYLSAPPEKRSFLRRTYDGTLGRLWPSSD